MSPVRSCAAWRSGQPVGALLVDLRNRDVAGELQALPPVQPRGCGRAAGALLAGCAAGLLGTSCRSFRRCGTARSLGGDVHLEDASKDVIGAPSRSLQVNQKLLAVKSVFKRILAVRSF